MLTNEPYCKVLPKMPNAASPSSGQQCYYSYYNTVWHESSM